MSIIEQYREEIEAASVKIKDRLHEIERRLEELQAEKKEITEILRKTDQLPKQNGKPKKSGRAEVASETLDRFFAALELLDAGAIFYAGMLEADPRFDFLSRSSISKALTQLHDDGRIALHSTGQGGRKNYMVAP